MFNLFKTEKKQVDYPMRQVSIAPPKATNNYPEIVNRIHKEFNEAGEIALAEAKMIISQSKVENEEKAKRLSYLGFTNTKECKEFREKDETKKKAKDVADALAEASQKYPQYKFLTKKSAEKICEKYNLYIGDIHQYMGFVPEKNLKDIENFYNTNNPLAILYSYSSYSGMGRDVEVTKEEYNKYRKESSAHSGYANESKRYLKIAAPAKDMDTHGYKLKGREFVKEDPIVMAPVKVNNVDLMCVVTAWGDEASDPEVVNEKNN